MGFVIKYCEECGARIPEADLESGAAVETARGTFCKNHVPATPEPAPPRRGSTSNRAPAVKRSSSTSNRMAATTRRSSHSSLRPPSDPPRRTSSRRTAVAGGKAGVRPTTRRTGTSGRSRIVTGEDHERASRSVRPDAAGRRSGSRAPLLIVLTLALALGGGVVALAVSGSTTGNGGNREERNSRQTATGGNTGPATNQPDESAPDEQWRKQLAAAQQEYATADLDGPDAAETAAAAFDRVLAMVQDGRTITGLTHEDFESAEHLLDRWATVASEDHARTVLAEAERLEQAEGVTAATEWMGDVVNGRAPDWFPPEYLRDGAKPFRDLLARVEELRRTRAEQLDIAANAMPLFLDRATSGTLDASDKTLTNGEYIDWFSFEAERGQRFGVSMESAEFDAYLLVLYPDARTKEVNDDHSGTRDAKLELRATQSGRYLIGCTSATARETGRYIVEYTRLPDTDPTDVVDIEPGDRRVRVPSLGQRQFRLELPEELDRESVEFRVIGDEGDVDLYIRPGVPFLGYAMNTEFKSTSRDSTEVQYLVRPKEGGDMPHLFYVLLNNCRVEPTEVVLRIVVNGPKPPPDTDVPHDVMLAPDRPAAVNTPVGRRNFVIARVDVPAGVTAMRGWLDKAEAVGLLVGRDTPPMSVNAALLVADEPTNGTLEFRLAADDGSELQPGPYYVVVARQRPEPFSTTLRIEFER